MSFSWNVCIHKHKKLSSSQVEAIRSEYASKNTTQTELAIRYGVSQNCIWKVIHEATWKNQNENPADKETDT